MQRDAIDFGKTRIGPLFVRLLVPTFLGLLFGALFNIADGIFVGRGVGSDALAAVNVAAPMFMLFSGIALMFGTGVSVVCAIHLSKGSVKAARINATQAFTVALLLGLLLFAAAVFAPRQINFLFGGSAVLEPYVCDYLRYGSVGMVGSLIAMFSLFVIRLDGSPRYAMMTNIVPALLNIFLDWLFVFPFNWGIKGAAAATSLSEMVCVAMVVIYFWKYAKTINFYRPKFSNKAIRLTLRNLGYMVRLGLPTFLGEGAMLCAMIVGNIMFMSRLREDGVAAYSVACYLFPLVFMFGNAVAQSALPIVSYNHGLGQTARIRQTFRLSTGTAAVCGLLLSGIVAAVSPALMFLFLGGAAGPTAIGNAGLPLYATGFAFFSLNIVLIGFLQAIERSKAATFFMLLRGYLLVVPCFVALPSLIGDKGLWLAVPLSETLTFAAMATLFLLKKRELFGQKK